jgi:PQQ-dependent catabolism-associated CXXCW motif protein
VLKSPIADRFPIPASAAAIRAVAALSIACALVALSNPLWAQDSFGQPKGQPPAPGPSPAKPAARDGAGASRGQSTPASGLDAELLRMEPLERKDMGIPSKATLHSGPMHGPTPVDIPGGRLATTREIYELVRRTRGDRGSAPRSFDILGDKERLPGALLAVPAGQPGSFEDSTQREFGQFLQGVMQGRKDLPMIFYCASNQCWLSYNAALRAIKLGYANVLWYRGGLEAWKHAQLPMDTADSAPGAPNGPVPAQPR